MSEVQLPSRTIAVLGTRLHYFELGSGRPILFLHGMPSWSYVWRNVLPIVAAGGRTLALDLVGHGRSGSPSIEFRFVEHARYLEEFVHSLGLHDLVLAGHSWGATLAMDYARRFPERVAAIAFLEPMLRPFASWSEFNPESPEARDVFRAFRTPEAGWRMIVEENLFLSQVFTRATLRELAPEEREAYLAPFRDPLRRKAAWRAPQELPIEGAPSDVVAIVERNREWLERSSIPKLFFKTHPAAFYTPEMVAEAKRTIPLLRVVDLGAGVYNHVEDHPREVGQGIRDWLIEHGLAATEASV